MTGKQVFTIFESLGTAQNRKIYARHGADSSNTFGVSFANLSKLRKRIKGDHSLAAELWKTGNFDARNLATMIADPASMTMRELDEWARDAGSYCVAEMFARNVAAKTAFAPKLIEKWTKSKSDLTCVAGYALLACAAMNDQDAADSYFEDRLTTIEAGIHQAGNWTRYAMNGALIAIGLRNSRLRGLALLAAARIGKVTVDHGETGCKTPDATAYIQKAAGRKAALGKAGSRAPKARTSSAA